MKNVLTLPLILVAITVTQQSTLAGDWLNFRGTYSNSVAADPVPTNWEDDQNIAWKAELSGRGPSSPIVVGDRVIVTSATGYLEKRLQVQCFDKTTGKSLWERGFWATGRTYAHPTSGVAAPTPASDGKRIFAFYSSNDLACLDLDGNLLWYRGLAFDFPKAGNDIGMASSPIVAEDTVIVQVENQGDSFATGINAETGETRWRIPRPAKANWTSPVILPANGDRPATVILEDGLSASAHNIRTGEVVWKLEQEFGTITSAVPLRDSLFLPTGGLTRLDFTKDSESYSVAWESNKLKSGSTSPVVDGDHIYVLNGGVLKCGSAEDGTVLWQLRVPGRYWATPVVAGEHIYCINQEGEARVVKPGEKKGEIVAENAFGEPVLGTPAAVDGALFVRGDKHLWCISQQ